MNSLLAVPTPLFPQPRNHVSFPNQDSFVLTRGSAFCIFAEDDRCRTALEFVGLQGALSKRGILSTILPQNPLNIDVIHLSLTISDEVKVVDCYDLQIRSSGIFLVADSIRGLIYGLTTLMQLLSTSMVTQEPEIHLAAQSVKDAPRLCTRALFCSYQFHFLGRKSDWATLLRLLSTARLTTLLVSLDALDDINEVDNASSAADVKEFVDRSERLGIEVIPALFVKATGEWRAVLKWAHNISSRSILLVIDLPVEAHSMDNILEVKSQWRLVCGQLMSALQTQEFSRVHVCGRDHSVQQFKLLECEESWSTIYWPLETLLPTALQRKPITCIQDFAETILTYCNSQSEIAVFPIHLERDFLCPDIVMKFYLLWFTNSACSGDILKSSSEESCKTVERLFSTILQSDVHATPDELNALMNLCSAKRAPESVQSPQIDMPVAPRIATEQAMWSIVLSNDDVLSADLPSADEALACNRFYRQILTTAKYKSSSKKLLRNQDCRWKFFNQSREALLDEVLWKTQSNELFLTIDILSMISRTVYVSSSITKSPKSSSEAAAVALTEVQSLQQKRAAVYDNVDMSKPYQHKIVPKTDEISAMLTNVVQKNILFRNFKSEEHARIVEAFDCVHIAPGEIVIKQGDSGEYFYIVESGSLDVYMESCGLRVKVGRTLKEGDYFGELALMYNTPRAATILSNEAGKLWRIDRSTYRMIVTHHNKITSDEFFELVFNVHILGKRLGDVLSSAQLNKVVSTLEVEEFEHGSIIIRQHQTGDYFYIISEGHVDVWQEVINANSSLAPPAMTVSGFPQRMNGSNKTLLGTKLATLQRGDCFGEKALLADDVRQASCVAVGKVVCLSLSREDFIAMIGSWQDITEVNNTTNLAAKQRRMRASVYDSQYHLSVDLEDLKKLNVLGIGAFGRVQVARHKDSGQLYALKYQSKSNVCAQNMQEMVLNEMHVMKQIDHPFISKLHGAMQDKKYIYFLLELLPGGDFFGYLQRSGKLPEDRCRFYSAAIVLALEELHKNKIAYRDIKPENMVMDSRGYVKLVDFGLAKHITSGSTWTMCGTPDYLAPEIILNKGHNHAVDYWALGVLMFEMVQGWPPFYHDQPMKVYEKILLGKVEFRSHCSKPFEDIITKFLVNNPSKRLGNMKGGVGDITKHKWYGSFDWQGLLAGTLMAPYLPDLRGFDSALAAYDDEDSDEEDPDEFDCEESDWNPELY